MIKVICEVIFTFNDIAKVKYWQLIYSGHVSSNSRYSICTASWNSRNPILMFFSYNLPLLSFRTMLKSVEIVLLSFQIVLKSVEIVLLSFQTVLKSDKIALSSFQIVLKSDKIVLLSFQIVLKSVEIVLLFFQNRIFLSSF